MTLTKCSNLLDSYFKISETYQYCVKYYQTYDLFSVLNLRRLDRQVQPVL